MAHDGSGTGRDCGILVAVGCGAEGGNVDDECRVTEFEMDGYDDTAVASLCTAVRFCFLCGLRDLMDWGREKVDLVFLLH